MDSLLKYYGIPTLSMRNALHGLLTQTPQLLDQLWWPAPDPKIHPTCVGARYAKNKVWYNNFVQIASLLLQEPYLSNTFALHRRLPDVHRHT